jgi:hypothetical protein
MSLFVRPIARITSPAVTESRGTRAFVNVEISTRIRLHDRRRALTNCRASVLARLD